MRWTIGLALGVALAAFAPAAPRAQDATAGRALVIPQDEGERLGRTLGRAIACGIPRERTAPVIAAARERMLRAVGRALTEERFLLALDDALGLEASLPPPAAVACARATAAFERLEATPRDP